MQTASYVRHPEGLVWFEAPSTEPQAYSAERRSFVMEALHYNGSKRDQVAEHVWRKCYILDADGFGKVGLSEASEMCWDWSHVRDSSPEAIEAMYARLRTEGVR